MQRGVKGREKETERGLQRDGGDRESERGTLRLADRIQPLSYFELKPLMGFKPSSDRCRKKLRGGGSALLSSSPAPVGAALVEPPTSPSLTDVLCPHSCIPLAHKSS